MEYVGIIVTLAALNLALWLYRRRLLAQRRFLLARVRACRMNCV